MRRADGARVGHVQVLSGRPGHEALGTSAACRTVPAGPYLLESREDGTLLGSTGLGFETLQRAATGYVLAKDAWGLGYATEALRAVIDIARGVGVTRLYALCHPENPASWRVLEKCGFFREGVLPRHSTFPNLDTDGPCDVLCYAVALP